MLGQSTSLPVWVEVGTLLEYTFLKRGDSSDTAFEFEIIFKETF